MPDSFTSTITNIAYFADINRGHISVFYLPGGTMKYKILAAYSLSKLNFFSATISQCLDNFKMFGYISKKPGLQWGFFVALVCPVKAFETKLMPEFGQTQTIYFAVFLWLYSGHVARCSFKALGVPIKTSLQLFILTRFQY